MKQEPRYPVVHVGVCGGDAEEACDALWELGATGIEERDDTTLDVPDPPGASPTLVAHFPDDESAQAAVRALSARWRARVCHIVGDEWRDAWRAHFKPSRVGRRIVVRPSWEDVDAQPGDVVLTIDPGRAFGTGTHESTRLVLAALDRRLSAGARVLDVGTGSGILSIGALLLGAAEAIAVDVDPDVLPVAAENARLNGVEARLSISSACAAPVTAVAGVFDVVLANIEADVLIPLAGELAARTRAGGLLVLSGILAEQQEEVLRAYRSVFELVDAPQEGEWIALVMQRRAA